VVQVVTLTSTLTDTAKDRVTTVSLGNVVDKFSNEHSLSDTSTTKETNLSTLGVRGQQVNDLDTSLEHFGDSGLVNKLGRVSVDGERVLGVDRTPLINGLTNDVDDTSKAFRADRDGDGSTAVNNGLTTNETLSTVHSNGTDSVFTKVLGDFKDETDAVALNLQGVQDRGKLSRVELHVNDGTDNGTNLSGGDGSGSSKVAAGSNTGDFAG